MAAYQEEDGEDVLPALPKSKAKAKGHLASLFSSDSSSLDEASRSAAPSAVASVVTNVNLAGTGMLPVVDAPFSVQDSQAEQEYLTRVVRGRRLPTPWGLGVWLTICM